MKLPLAHLLPLVTRKDPDDTFAFPGTSVSWASGRLDVFINDFGLLYHKYHANPDAGWNKDFETMDFPLLDMNTHPTAISWAENRLDIFAASQGGLFHKFWDGSQWNPEKGAEELASEMYGTFAVTSWAEGRFDIIGLDHDGGYSHKYWDGTAWKPDGLAAESLGTDGFDGQFFASYPTAVSWGENRLDIFGILSNATLLHKYWDGNAWQPSATGWESWGDDFFDQPVATSWGENRLDVWAVREDGQLAHRYWTGSTLSDIETLGGSFHNTPTITHWGANRIDIFGITTGGSVVYKYWDGYQWNPSDNSKPWSAHGSGVVAGPSSVAWSANNINTFALDSNGTLKWQFWEGSQWLPKPDGFYDLGTLPAPDSSMIHLRAMKKSKPNKAPNNAFVVQDLERGLDL